MNVDVIIEEDRWQDTDVVALAKRAVSHTLTHLDMDPAFWKVAILATDDAKIAQLNLDFRGKARATNVLSWPAAEWGASVPGNAPQRATGGPELGDIALSFETCTREANETGKPLEEHVQHLIIHGTLHLLGYDHQYESDADLMETTEIAILGKLGVSSPYIKGGAMGVVDDGKD